MEASEKERIVCHLQYVHYVLSNTNQQLTETAKTNRQHCLHLLEQYTRDAKFPVNEAYANQRRPCFIDTDGTLCAVGHLLANTAGRAEAERINTRFQYAYLPEMKDKALVHWASQQGFTLRELAIDSTHL